MDFDDVVEKLKTQRDELRVQAHLMKADIKEEFDTLEDKWDHLESRMAQVKKASKASAGEVGAAAEQLVEELGAAYRRIRASLR